DRLNEHVATLYQPFHPAVLRLMRGVCDAGGRCGKLVGVCGEMAADPLAAPLFVGMGMRELSMDPQSIPAIKSVIRRMRKSEAARLTGELLALDSAGEIVTRLRRYLDDLTHTNNPE
ncbi:MAG: putative PEP-binding protein, partial [Acidobacteriota bacterium]